MMTVTPVVPAVARPVFGSMVATGMVLEPQTAALMVAVPIVALTFVRFTVAPDEVVPMAMNCAGWPAEVSVCDAGMMDIETSGSGAVFMVNVATPVTTVPSGFLTSAVMATVPGLTAEASPVAGFTVAIAALLEPQTAGLIVAAPTVALTLVRFTVAPDDVVPIAMNCAV